MPPKKHMDKTTPEQITQAVYERSYRKINEKIGTWKKN